VNQGFTAPLLVKQGSVVWGVPYPRPDPSQIPSEIPPYVGLPNLVDLVLSPLPFRYWCCALRINILLKHEAGALASVSEQLFDQGLVLLSTEASRCAHRYANWSIVVGFPDLADRFAAKPSSFSPESFKREMGKKEKSIKQSLAKNSDAIFSQSGDFEIELESPIKTRPIGELAYFYDYATSVLAKQNLKPFTLVAEDNEFCLASSHLGSRLKEVGSSFGISPVQLPCAGFAESQFETCMMRISLLPETEGMAMKVARFDYNNTHTADRRLEVIKELSKALGKDWLLWRLLTTTSKTGEDGFSGSIQAIMSSENRTLKTPEEFDRSLVEAVESAQVNLTKDYPGVTLTLKPHFPLPKPKVALEYLRSKRFYDVFVCHVEEDAELIKPLLDYLEFSAGITYFLDKFPQGDERDVSSRIRAEMHNCKELILLGSRKTVDSYWVNLELGMAIEMQKHITVVRTHSMTLPQKLRLDQQLPPTATTWTTDIEFDKAVDEIQLRIYDWTNS
jgi:hypothetical protein